MYSNMLVYLRVSSRPCCSAWLAADSTGTTAAAPGCCSWGVPPGPSVSRDCSRGMGSALDRSCVKGWMEPSRVRKMTPYPAYGTQHSTAQHSTAQHSTAQHSTAQHSTAQHSTQRWSEYEQGVGTGQEAPGSWSNNMQHRREGCRGEGIWCWYAGQAGELLQGRRSTKV
jgi:hypothetical protein